MNIVHGGDIFRIARQRGWDWKDVLDFSANMNPLGPAPGVPDAIREAIDRIRHYPSPESVALSALLSKEWGVRAAQILLGNGATDLLHFFARMRRDEPVTLVVPTFSEFHRAYPNAAMARWDDFDAWPTSGLVVLTTPNNPTGRLARADLLQDWLLRTSHPVMVDESFLDFTDAPSVLRLLPRRPDLFVLRSLTKFYAIPGLRVGALVGGEEEIAVLRHFREPWQVNVLAEAAAIASVQDSDYAIRSRSFIEQERQWLMERVAQFPGVRVEPSCVNFLYARVDYDPARLCAFLLESKILLRNCSLWKGFEQRSVRVAVRTREANTRLLNAWSEFQCDC
jgi:threonine-phosphate decarboxylase